ncbi:MAG: glycosyltransferase family A protein [Anaerolineae bacterium]
MTSESVSVIIPVYNGEQYLAEAIDSVLAQTRPPGEIIVVDDGSTDGSAEVVAAYGEPVRYLRQANQGPSSARNFGVEQAKGELLAWLDQDDLWEPDKLERQIAYLEQNKNCEAVLGRAENFISPELGVAQRYLLARAVAQAGDVHIGVLLIRRPAFMRIGWFRTDCYQTDFAEWWARAQRRGLATATVSGVLLWRRLHINNLSRRTQGNYHEFLTMLREHVVLGRSAPSAPESSETE